MWNFDGLESITYTYSGAVALNLKRKDVESNVVLEKGKGDKS